MLPDERDAAYLWDMLDAARVICEFTKGMDLEQYLRDRMTQAAVERKAGIIGEAARQISDAYKKAHPEVPWRKIISYAMCSFTNTEMLFRNGCGFWFLNASRN